MKKYFKTVFFILGVILLSLYFSFFNKNMEMKNTQERLQTIIDQLKIKEDFFSINFELNNKIAGLWMCQYINYLNNFVESKNSITFASKKMQWIQTIKSCNV